MNKKVLLIGFLWIILITFAFSQNGEHVDGGHFIKRIEYNVESKITLDHNLKSKGVIQKMFFGDFNAPVEFYYLPSSEAAYWEPYSGFRIVSGVSHKSYSIEVKYISNYAEATKEAQKRYPTIGNNLTTAHNREALINQTKESLKLYKIETLLFPISNQLAERMYKKMISLIDNFKAKGAPPLMVDGEWVEFRIVVEDELWSLYIYVPRGDSLKMSDLCRQIIRDARENKLDESKYMAALNAFIKNK